MQAAVNELVNERVKRRMSNLGWSIRDLTTPLGHSPDWLWRRYEQRTNWSVADVVCAAEILGLPARELMPDVAAATARAAALQHIA